MAPNSAIPVPREPIEAEIVPPPPSPLRFGLQELMVVMALCSVQFAVMNYLGVLLGFVVGGFVCLFAMAAVMLVGLSVGTTDPELFQKLDRLAIRLVLALSAILVSGLLSGGGLIVLGQLNGLQNVWNWERSLGLATAHDVALLDNHPITVLRIVRVDLGSPADQAGLKLNDRFIPEPSVAAFYENLKNYRGQDYELTIYRGSSALNRLEDRTEMEVTLPIPAK